MKINSKVRQNRKDKDKDNNENNWKYIDEKINGLSYNMAIKYDKRTYCQFYASLLKKHNII